MALKLGMDGKMYFLSTGSRATWGTADGDGVHEGAAPGNLTEMGNVRDVTLNLEHGEADVTTRSNGGWRASAATLKEGTVEFDMIYDTADASFTKIFAAWLAKSTIALAILDGANSVVDVEGLWADFNVISFSKSEPLEEGQSVSVTVKPTYSTVAPEWVRVTA